MKGFRRHIAVSVAITAVFVVCAAAIGIAAAPATLPNSAEGAGSFADASVLLDGIPVVEEAVEEAPQAVTAPIAEPLQAVEADPEPVAVAPVLPVPAPEAAPTEPANPQPAAPPAPATPPNPPKDLVGTFVPAQPAYVSLTWNSNNTKKVIDHFNVYRLVLGEPGQGNVPPIGQSKKAEYKDNTIKQGSAYRYWVTAVTSGGEESGASNLADVKTYSATTPAAPRDIRAVAIDPGVSFDWLPNTDVNLAGYNVYEPKGGSANWRKLNGEPITDNHYYYASGVAGATYAVSAVNFYGVESEYVKVQAVVSTPVLYEENDPSITVEGLWVSEGYIGPANERIRVAGDAGAKLHFKFKGSQVKMIVARYWTCGDANVYIDGVLVKTINLYSYSPVYNVVDVNAPGIKYGEHVLTVEALGSGNPEGTHNFVNVDAFEVR